MIGLHPLPYLTHPEVWERPDEFVQSDGLVMGTMVRMR